MRDPGRNTWTFGPGEDPAADLVPPAPFDALSDPTVEDLLPAGLALWPRGAAWGTPDGQAASTESGIANLTRALLAPFTDLYRRADGLTKESRAQTLVDSLPDWEVDFGLPDECAAPGAGEAARRRALLSRVRSLATITPADFVALARQEGFEIAIEEPATFECGFSECGGAHTTGGALEQVYWIVHVYALAVDYFTCGESECGFDPLFTVDGVERLQCLFRRLYPGWSQPVYVIHDRFGADDLVAQMGEGLALDFLDQSFALRVANEPDLARSGPLETAPGWTFARASTALRINAAGVYESVAPNVLRIDHDPVTLAPRGALFERAGANYVANSAALGASPSAASSSDVPGAPTGWRVTLFGGCTAQIVGTGVDCGIEFVDVRLTGTNGAAYGALSVWFTTFVAAAAGQRWTASTYLKRVSGGTSGIYMGGSTAVHILGNNAADTTIFDVAGSNGIIPNAGLFSACRVDCSNAVLPGNTTSISTIHQTLIYPSATVDITLRYGWPQLEQGVISPTSPIRTTGAVAYRAADALSVPLTAVPWSPTEGTLMVDAMRLDDGTDKDHPAAALLDGGGRRIQITAWPDKTVNIYAAADEGVQTFSSIGALTAGQPWKVAVGWRLNDLAAVRETGALLADTTFIVPTLATLNIGNVLGSVLDGYVRRVALIPRRMSNAELQALAS